MRHLRFFVLGDGVVPDFSFVVCVVLLGWVHAPGVRGHLGLTDVHLKTDVFSQTVRKTHELKQNNTCANILVE